ncbi:MAG: dihydrodipicolinate synthase family protein [Bryobacteraceae bacterium]
MRHLPLQPDDFRGVFPVPPLCRREDGSLDLAANRKLLDHIAAGGIRNFIYGGNAFLYHLTLREIETLCDWMGGLPDDWLLIPSAGPSFGRAMDAAPIFRTHSFPLVMMLPCGDPRDATGIERGYVTFSLAAGSQLLLYIKDEHTLGPDKEAGLDMAARLMERGYCAGVKYAVVRADPNQDDYLKALLARVDRARVLSGMGERPAVAHLRDWDLPGFTTGSGCLAPALSAELLRLVPAGEIAKAEEVRQRFLPLEDLRDAWGPSRVLHAAVDLAGLVATGPIPPFVSPLSAEQSGRVAPAARELLHAVARV